MLPAIPSAGVNRWEATDMWRTLLLASVLPFVSAFLGGALAFSLVAAPQATAQSSQPQEVRASAFTLVGADGTVLAQLAPNPSSGTGRLSLRDAAGTERVTLAGGGTLNVYDQDGTTVVFRAGRGYDVGPTSGLPPPNGLELGPGGSIRMLGSPR
jgi:hypothetical protein